MVPQRLSDLYDANLAAMLLRTAVDEFHAMPFHMKRSSCIDAALSWCEQFYESVTGESYRWENEIDRTIRQRLRYGNE